MSGFLNSLRSLASGAAANAASAVKYDDEGADFSFFGTLMCCSLLLCRRTLHGCFLCISCN